MEKHRKFILFQLGMKFFNLSHIGTNTYLLFFVWFWMFRHYIIADVHNT